MDATDVIIEKNKSATLANIIRIIIGGILSAIIIAVILIFRNSRSFTHGRYSALDFMVFFLFFTVAIMIEGIIRIKNCNKMPRIMLTYRSGASTFHILDEEVHFGDIKKISGEFDFGKTGTIKITTVDKVYKLYGAVEYAGKIKQLNAIVENYNNSTANENIETT